MTANAKCSKCNEIANHFEYNHPRKNPNDINDGEWLCQRHLKDFYLEREERREKLELNPKVRSVSRAERRAAARRKKIF